MKRKAVVLALCGMLVLSAVGCGQKDETSSGVKYDVDDYVTLGEYSGLTVELTDDYTVTEDLINSTMEGLIAQAAPLVADDTQTVVQSDSLVNVDYVGKMDGVAFSGGTASNVSLDVASNSDLSSGSSYIDGFTSGLVGAKVGDVIDCDVTFPESYGNESLAGQQVTFMFTINYIGKKMTVDQLTDAFVSENFGAATVDEFKKTVETYVNQTAENSRQNDIRSAVMEQVQANATVDEVPEDLLKLRVQEYAQVYENLYCNGTTLEKYLSSNYGVTVDQFMEDITESIKENLVVELIFEAIAKKEGIELDEEGFEEYCQNLMENNDLDSREDLYTAYAPEAKTGESYLRKMYVCNLACEFCVDRAVVKDAAAE